MKILNVLFTVSALPREGGFPSLWGIRALELALEQELLSNLWDSPFPSGMPRRSVPLAIYYSLLSVFWFYITVWEGRAILPEKMLPRWFLRKTMEHKITLNCVWESTFEGNRENLRIMRKSCRYNEMSPLLLFTRTSYMRVRLVLLYSVILLLRPPSPLIQCSQQSQETGIICISIPYLKQVKC